MSTRPGAPPQTPNAELLEKLRDLFACQPCSPPSSTGTSSVNNPAKLAFPSAGKPPPSPETAVPASPTLPAITSEYADPIDVRRWKTPNSPNADDAYTYSEPINLQTPPVKSKPKPKPGKNDAISFSFVPVLSSRKKKKWSVQQWGTLHAWLNQRLQAFWKWIFINCKQPNASRFWT